MRDSWLAAIIPGIVVIILGVFIVALLLVKLLWAWTIPDIFPGAVEQGLVAGSISWFTALKMAILLAVLAGVAGLKHNRN